MSESLLPNRLSYARDFLLQYQHIYKPDPIIEEKVTGYVVSPRSTQFQNFAGKANDYQQRTKPTNEQTHTDKTQKVQKPREERGFIPSSFKPRTTGQSTTTGQNNNNNNNSENSEPVTPSRWSNLQSLSAGPSPFKSHFKFGSIPRLTLANTHGPSPASRTSNPPGSIPQDNPTSAEDPNIPGPQLPGTSRVTGTDLISSSPSRFRSMSDPSIQTPPPPLFHTSPQKSTITTTTPNNKIYKTPESKKISPFRSNNKTTPRKVGNNTPGHPGSPSCGGRITPVDDQRLMQRQKQIDYGYRTFGYVNYRIMVPKDKRKPEHPRTPKRSQNCSKRSWDGQLKKWRRDLHLWDPNNLDAFKALLKTEKDILIALYPELTDIAKTVYQKLEDPTLIMEDEESISDDTDSPSSPRTSQVNPNDSQKSTDQAAQPRLEKVARALIF